MDVLKIDGSFGEGGGQILRTAVSLSCITKKPIQIENIRNNRKNPGLRPQHLVAIKLLSKICNAKVEGLHTGSTLIRFFPNEIQNMHLDEDVGTAGSISLILQTLILPASLSKKKIELSIRGGTDVPWSPTMNYTKHVLSEAYRRIGINFSVKIRKRGYYPRGGGFVEASISPSTKLKPLSLSGRVEKNANVLCTSSNIMTSKISSTINDVKIALENNGFTTTVETIEETAANKGASILIFNHDANSIAGYDELLDNKNGLFGKTSTTEFINCDAGVDNQLSDMLVAPLSLINGLSVFTVKEITKHLETNLYITSKITGCKYGVGKTDTGFEIRIQGSSDSCIQ